MHAERTGFTFVEHTADLGIRATATSLCGLFVQAARGMYALLGPLKPGTEPVEKILQLQAPDTESLLHDWLTELLWELDGNDHLFDSLELEWLDDQHMTAHCRGTVLDAQQSQRTVEIKAVTYHDLQIRKCDDTYEVTVIFDV
jgi:SHS2 domain-containing protein